MFNILKALIRIAKNLEEINRTLKIAHSAALQNYDENLKFLHNQKIETEKKLKSTNWMTDDYSTDINWNHEYEAATKLKQDKLNGVFTKEI